MTLRPLTLILTLSVVAATASVARAQGHHTAVLISVSEPADSMLTLEELASRAQEMASAWGIALLDTEVAIQRYLAVSRPPARAEGDDLDVVAREAKRAVEHVVYGRTSAAQQSVQAVISRAERALESLNRENVVARQLLDACLALVRVEVHAGNRALALEQASRCRRLVPDIPANAAIHPPEVIAVLTEAEEEARQRRSGRLWVGSQPDQGCAVLINGRRLGITPFVVEGVMAGPYRVQVECGEGRGRVHLVELGAKPVELLVDAELDRAVRSEPRLSLEYRQEPLAPTLVAHACRIGADVGAREVVTVELSGETARLTRMAVEHAQIAGRVTLAWPPEGASDEQLEAALRELWDGAPVPPLSPSSSSSDAQPDVERLGMRASTRFWVAGSLLGAATATMVTGIYFEHERARIDGEMRRAHLPFADEGGDDYERASSLRWIGVGGLLATGAVPLLVRPHETPPWWSYAIGAAGLGLMGVGVYDLATATRCESYATDLDSCLEERASEARGALFMVAGAPLLAVPFSHWLLGSQGFVDASAGLSPDRRGLFATLRFTPKGAP